MTENTRAIIKKEVCPHVYSASVEKLFSLSGLFVSNTHRLESALFFLKGRSEGVHSNLTKIKSYLHYSIVLH